MKRYLTGYSCLYLFLFLVLLSGCGLKRTVTVDYAPSEPLRVLVLPFVQLDNAGEIIEEDAHFFVDGIPLLSEELAENPAELLRQMVQSELTKTNLDVLAPYLVNLELPHHGYAHPNGAFALKKLYGADPAILCSHFLDCDAVLYGWVTEWERSYYGIQTVNTVAARLRLASARTGDVLYEVEVSNKDGRGVSGIPTGFSDLVLEPIKGLDSKYIEAAARQVAEDAIAPLRAGFGYAYESKAPPSIFAVAHGPNVVPADGSIAVMILAYAQPDGSMSFSIGEKIKDFPMFEVEPYKYVGEYRPVPGERLSEKTVTVTLADRFGRKTHQTSASGTVAFR